MPPRKSAARTSAANNKKSGDRVLWSAVLFALGALFLAFALIEGESAWTAVHGIIRGLFGISVFFVPLTLIYVSLIIALDKSVVNIQGRVVQCMIFILLISAFIQIAAVGELEGEGVFAEIMPNLYENGKKLSGGGVFSIVMAGPLLALFKKTGATIIISLLTFVFLLLISNKTIIDIFRFFGGLAKSANRVREEDISEERDKPAVSQAAAKTPKASRAKGADVNIDIPIPAAKKAAESKKTAISVEELPFDLPSKNQSEALVSAAEKNKGLLKKSASDLDDIIKKAARESAEQKAGSADYINSARVKSGSKHSTLASNKIAGDGELDILKATTAEDIQHEIAVSQVQAPVYAFPPVSLLKFADNSLIAEDAQAEMKANADTLVDTLNSFGVQTRIVDIHRGPTVTRYELQPSAGVKISKITGLSDDIALNLAAAGVRIEAPIPGKAAVGVEVPNKIKDIVSIREMIESREFLENKSKLSFVVGKNIDGDVIIGDIARMPHVIIAGTTGSGKSVCTNSVIMSILYNASPDEVRLVLIDPKMVEFKTYDGIPHLLIPVVTDPRKAAGALSWAVQEMLKRYKLFADANVRDLTGYNEMAAESDGVEPLPRIVIAIDELADLMMAAANEVEDSICRLAQMARAAGMHLIIATQRPTVDVITGLIKANIPSRIALTVSSAIDSRTIIDTAGAEKLLGNGDMLYYPQGCPKPVRVQGCFCSTKEVEAVVSFIKSGGDASYSDEIIREIEKNMPSVKNEAGGSDGEFSPGADGDEDIIERATEVLIDAGQASVSYLQRKLKLGYARAARVMDDLEARGIVGPYEGSKPREVLISREMWLQRKLINGDAEN